MEGFVQGLSYGVGYICAISGNREDLEKVPAAAQKIYEDKQAWCKALSRDERSSYGMDVKTLSTIIGHVSSATTLNVYAHVTDDMPRQAAAKIDRGIVKVEAPAESSQAETSRTMTDFKAQHGKHRYWGSGYLGQRKGGRWAGQYTIKWPDGKKVTRSVYAGTEEECERLLATMIREMKTEAAAEKERLRTENQAS